MRSNGFSSDFRRIFELCPLSPQHSSLITIITIWSRRCSCPVTLASKTTGVQFEPRPGNIPRGFRLFLFSTILSRSGEGGGSFLPLTIPPPHCKSRFGNKRALTCWTVVDYKAVRQTIVDGAMSVITRLIDTDRTMSERKTAGLRGRAKDGVKIFKSFIGSDVFILFTVINIGLLYEYSSTTRLTPDERVTTITCLCVHVPGTRRRGNSKDVITIHI